MIWFKIHNKRLVFYAQLISRKAEYKSGIFRVVQASICFRPRNNREEICLHMRWQGVACTSRGGAWSSRGGILSVLTSVCTTYNIKVFSCPFFMFSHNFELL
jgi:hypothetical protein